MTEEKIKAAARASLTQYMDEHKMRKTPERFAILEKVMETAGHFSIEELNQNLNASGYHVSRATVYNTIELLTKCGLVRRHAFVSQSPQYEKITTPVGHYHLICTSCGKIREIKDTEIDHLLAVPKRFGKFMPSFIDLNIYGLCGTCQRKVKTPSKIKIDNKPI